MFGVWGLLWGMRDFRNGERVPWGEALPLELLDDC